ncbi:MAG: hypothetical protein HGA19_03890, partial [Oscillochloris sp.]|nr:hypothetical protein [Oscillochloris sp.]
MIWYSILMLITIAAAIQIAWHVWGKQEMHGRAAIMIAMLAIVVWAMSTITQLLIPSISVLQVGTIVSAVMRTIFGTMLLYGLLAYTSTSQDRTTYRINRLLQAAATAMLGLLILQIASNPFIHLWNTRSEVAHNGNLTLLFITPGKGRLLIERINYVILISGYIQALRLLGQTVEVQRRAAQPILISIGGSISILLGFRLIYGDALFPVVY